MAIVQAKLQECIGSGHLNSFDRLSNLFAGNTTTTTAAADGEDVEMSGTATTTTIAMKDASKIPSKKSKSIKPYSNAIMGMYGDKTSKKMGEKKYRKERTTDGNGAKKHHKERNTGGRSRSRGMERRSGGRSSSKKRSGKKLATI